MKNVLLITALTSLLVLSGCVNTSSIEENQKIQIQQLETIHEHSSYAAIGHVTGLCV